MMYGKTFQLITLLILTTVITTTFNGCKSTEGIKNPFVGSLDGGGDSDFVLFQDVLPIFEERCMRCHSSQKPNWTNYEEAFAYVQSGLLKKRTVLDKSMPQSGSPEASAMTDSERTLIDTWITDGGKLNADDVAAEPVPEDELNQEPIWAIANKCAGCHGDQNPNTDGTVPLISGQNKEYLKEQLYSFKNDKRTNETMKAIAKGLSDEEIDFVTTIFSSIKLERDPIAPPSAPETVTNTINSCRICHQFSKNQNMPSAYPKIVGQNKDYLLIQLLSFKNGARTDFLSGGSFMNNIAESMNESMLEQLADYISQLRIEE